MSDSIPRISVVIPVLNEAPNIAAALGALQPLRIRGHEIIVADGGSVDATPTIAESLADHVLSARSGRAAQMNAGAAVGRGDALLFLHIDTRLPEGADALIAGALTEHTWGRFDVRIDSDHALLAVVGVMMNLRSRLTGIATGDQSMFMTRSAFERVKGFPNIALMEDVAMSARLKEVGPPACLRGKVVTSGRRWEKHGVVSTIALMWRLRLLYFLGADPQRLARIYARGH